MTSAKIAKINVPNSEIEITQSLKKKSAGKCNYYGMKDYIASIAGSKIK